MGELTFKAWLGSGSNLFATQQPYDIYAAALYSALAPMWHVHLTALKIHFLGGAKLSLTGNMLKSRDK